MPLAVTPATAPVLGRSAAVEVVDPVDPTDAGEDDEDEPKPKDGKKPAKPGHEGHDHGEHDPGAQVLRAAGQGQAPAAHVVGRDAVGEVDDGDLGGDRADHRVDDADELVGGPVVGQEGDGVEAGHRSLTLRVSPSRRRAPRSSRRGDR